MWPHASDRRDARPEPFTPSSSSSSAVFMGDQSRGRASLRLISCPENGHTIKKNIQISSEQVLYSVKQELDSSLSVDLPPVAMPITARVVPSSNSEPPRVGVHLQSNLFVALLSTVACCAILRLGSPTAPAALHVWHSASRQHMFVLSTVTTQHAGASWYRCASRSRSICAWLR